MVNILITHYSGVVFNGEYQSSCFYDGLIKGLTESGHNCMQVLTSEFLRAPWNGHNKPINSYLKHNLLEAIKKFKPDLVISFNNSSIEGIEDVLNCPIALWDSDTFQFFNDKGKLKKNADRYYYMAFSEYGVQDYIRNLKISESRVCRVPSATAIESENEKKCYNLSFIGNPFFNSASLIKVFIKYPHLIGVSSEYLTINKEKIERLLKPYNVSFTALQYCRSGDKRAQIIMGLLELGIKVFGPNEWLNLAPFASDLVEAYDPSSVYSLKHNNLIYDRSKVSLNVCHTQIITGYPWRVLDILASSSVLLSEFKPDLHRDLAHLVDLQLYASPNDAYNKARKILKDDSLRYDLISQQNAAIEQGFRWKHRLRLIEQLTGVPLDSTASQSSKGRYELFRFKLNSIDELSYKTAIYFSRRKTVKKIEQKAKKLPVRMWIKRHIKISLWNIFKKLTPESVHYVFRKFRLLSIQTGKEYQ